MSVKAELNKKEWKTGNIFKQFELIRHLGGGNFLVQNNIGGLNKLLVPYICLAYSGFLLRENTHRHN